MAFRISTRWDGQSQVFDLVPGENLVGSDNGCDVQIPHPGVSRHHAVLLVLGETLELADLGSQNGTFVNGRRLTTKVELKGKASLAFGAVEASLETLRDDDTKAAVLPEFDEGSGSADQGDRDAFPTSSSLVAPATTASVGPLQLFALLHLPRFVATLGDLDPGRELEHAARAAGEMLGSCLPCAHIEIGWGEGVLYSTRSAAEEEPEPSLWTTERVGDLAVAAEFQTPSAGRLYSPILLVVAHLVARTLGPSAPVNRTETDATRRIAAEPPLAPPLPKPETLDPTLHGLYDKAAQVAGGDLHVLIEGASGTGKELLARFIHEASPRRDEAFIALNCAALPGDLLEAELFGIEKGVATGVDARPGRFEQADGGTLFLDEIGDMAPQVQSKILRVLQEQEVHRLGGLAARSADVRVISATHQDLDQMRTEGRFRDDLFHRIADWRVRLPTLAERAVDIPNLASYFLAREAGRRGIRARGISRAALRVLCRYPWPGNVRQLEREIKKATLFVQDGGLLDTPCLDPHLTQTSPPQLTLREYLETVERREIERALAATGNDVPRAAEDLGLPESTLYRKIRGFHLDADMAAEPTV